MPAEALLLTLAAAVVHAGWNVLLAGSRDTEAATASALGLGVVVFAPVAAALWRVDPAAVPWLVATNAIEIAFFVLLGAVYRRAELTLVYPLMRGLAPVLVLALQVVALGFATTPLEGAGVGAVAVGIALVRGLRLPRRGAAGPPVDPRALVLAIGASVCIAGYTLVDREGIRHAASIPYLELALVGPALFLPARLAAQGRLRALRQETGPRTLVVGVALFGAYTLVLAALRVGSPAAVSAVRESGVLFAAALGALVLRERVGPGRAIGSALVVGGIAMLALG